MRETCESREQGTTASAVMILCSSKRCRATTRCQRCKAAAMRRPRTRRITQCSSQWQGSFASCMGVRCFARHLERLAGSAVGRRGGIIGPNTSRGSFAYDGSYRRQWQLLRSGTSAAAMQRCVWACFVCGAWPAKEKPFSGLGNRSDVSGEGHSP